MPHQGLQPSSVLFFSGTLYQLSYPGTLCAPSTKYKTCPQYKEQNMPPVQSSKCAYSAKSETCPQYKVQNVPPIQSPKCAPSTKSKTCPKYKVQNVPQVQSPKRAYSAKSKTCPQYKIQNVPPVQSPKCASSTKSKTCPPVQSPKRAPSTKSKTCPGLDNSEREPSSEDVGPALSTARRKKDTQKFFAGYLVLFVKISPRLKLAEPRPWLPPMCPAVCNSDVMNEGSTCRRSVKYVTGLLVCLFFIGEERTKVTRALRCSNSKLRRNYFV